jgi:hypothetical protein
MRLDRLAVEVVVAATSYSALAAEAAEGPRHALTKPSIHVIATSVQVRPDNSDRLFR